MRDPLGKRSGAPSAEPRDAKGRSGQSCDAGTCEGDYRVSADGVGLYATYPFTYSCSAGGAAMESMGEDGEHWRPCAGPFVAGQEFTVTPQT